MTLNNEEITFYNQKDISGSIMIKFDLVFLIFLIKHLSSDIIERIGTYTDDKNISILNNYSKMTEAGIFNSFLSEIKFVYNFMYEYNNIDYVKSFFSIRERQMLCTSMSIFKDLKDKKQKEIEETCGSHFGHATEYYKWNPEDCNEYWLSEL